MNTSKNVLYSPVWEHLAESPVNLTKHLSGHFIDDDN